MRHVIFILFSSNEQRGGGCAARLFILLIFPCSADHERLFFTDQPVFMANVWYNGTDVFDLKYTAKKRENEGRERRRKGGNKKEEARLTLFTRLYAV